MSQKGIKDGNRYTGEIYLSLKNDKPCVLLVSTDKGKTYTRKACDSTSSDGWHDYIFNISSDMKLAICLAGDVDMDGEVTSMDAMAILKYDVKKEPLNALQLAIADVDYDNEVSSVDAMDILKYDVKKKKLDW